MKSGGGIALAFQNTQELIRSIKTRKVRWINVSHFANCTILVFESSTNGKTLQPCMVGWVGGRRSTIR